VGIDFYIIHWRFPVFNTPAWYSQPARVRPLDHRDPDGHYNRITVVVPTRNEGMNLRPVLERVRPYADELLVIDGHSRDDTRAIATELGARVILDDGRGKGAALRLGIAEATGDILVFIDADGSHDPDDIPALVQPILKGEADHVSGSRMLGGSDELHSTINQFIRHLGSQIITLSINYTQGVSLTDCENGFRAIRRKVAQALDLRENIVTIEQELVIKSVRSGYRLAEVATHEYSRANGRSNFSVAQVWPRFVYSWIYYLLVWRPTHKANVDAFTREEMEKIADVRKPQTAWSTVQVPTQER
jgi:dolichol-phosphate mannosyltransferase